MDHSTLAADRVVIKTVNKVAPNSAKSKIRNDSVELAVGLGEATLFPARDTQPDVDANYGKQPFLANTFRTRITQLGFELNVPEIAVISDTAVNTMAKAAGIVNAIHTGTFEIGQGTGTCDTEKYLVRDYLAFTHKIEYISATLVYIHFTARPLPFLLEAVGVEPANEVVLTIKFPANAAFPASGGVPGTADGKLKLVARLGCSDFPVAQQQQVAAEVYSATATTKDPAMVGI